MLITKNNVFFKKISRKLSINQLNVNRLYKILKSLQTSLAQFFGESKRLTLQNNKLCLG